MPPGLVSITHNIVVCTVFSQIALLSRARAPPDPLQSLQDADREPFTIGMLQQEQHRSRLARLGRCRTVQAGEPVDVSVAHLLRLRLEFENLQFERQRLKDDRAVHELAATFHATQLHRLQHGAEANATSSTDGGHRQRCLHALYGLGRLHWDGVRRRLAAADAFCRKQGARPMDRSSRRDLSKRLREAEYEPASAGL